MSDRLPYLRHKLDLNKNNTVAVIRKDDLKWAVEETERMRTENERLTEFYNKVDHSYREADALDTLDKEIKQALQEVKNSESTNQN